MKFSAALAFVLLSAPGLALVVATNSVDEEKPQADGKHPIHLSAPEDNSRQLSEDDLQKLAASAKQVQNAMRRGGVKENQKSSATAEEDHDNALRHRALKKGNDAKDVLLKNMKCGSCLEAPPLTEVNRGPFLDYQACNSEDDLHLWALKSLESTNTWYRFENEGTEECLAATEPNCSGVYMVKCDSSEPRQIWGVVGGHIVNFHCYVNDSVANSTPKVFLAANPPGSSCYDDNGVRIDLTSFESSSDDQAEEHADHYWVIVPTRFSGSADADEILLI